jgi:hypothetical protein
MGVAGASAHDCSSLDGGDIQEKAIALGLLVTVRVIQEGESMRWSRGPAPRRIRKRLGTLLASNFLDRLDRGEVIDRNQTRNPKSPKTVQAPKALQKFKQQKEGRS